MWVTKLVAVKPCKQTATPSSLSWDCPSPLTSFNQPPFTRTDLLEMELSGWPISLRESDYTPTIAASPFYVTHSNSSLWVVDELGVSKDNSFFKNIRLEKGSPFRLFHLDLAHHTFGYDTLTLFCTIECFICNELGFMIAKADTHLFTRSSKYVAQIPPSFIIAIPKHLIHPGDHTYTSNEATFGQHFYQKGSGKCVCQFSPRAWKPSSSPVCQLQVPSPQFSVTQYPVLVTSTSSQIISSLAELR